jgi:hypothetical protein
MSNCAVIQLQQKLIDSNCSVIEILRLAKIIASELELVDFENWINCELNGYNGIDNLPEYRTATRTLCCWNRIYGWLPVQINSKELEETLSKATFRQSIHSLYDIKDIPTNQYMLLCPGEISTTLNRLMDGNGREFLAWFNQPGQIETIIQAVKDKVLIWTCELKKQGILGENLMFTSQEKESAKSINVTISGGNVGTIGIDKSPTTINNNTTVVQGDFSSLKAELLRYGVSDNEIQTLKQCLDEDKGIGYKVKKWFTNLGNKVTESTSVSVISQLILKYLGISI